jgi:hypothetical protein
VFIKDTVSNCPTMGAPCIPPVESLHLPAKAPNHDEGLYRVGRAEEGTSSLRPESAFHGALESLPVNQDALILIDCQSVLF